MPICLVHDDIFRRLCLARDLLHERHDETVSLAQLAQRAGFSRYHFLRLFRDTFGKTPREYLIDLRLEKAREMLINDEAAVTEVCFRVGFSSLGSFSSLFSRKVGCAPTAYRRRIWHFRHVFGEPALVIPYCYLWRFGALSGESQFSRSQPERPQLS